MANRPVSNNNSAHIQKHTDYIAPSSQQNLDGQVQGNDLADECKPGIETVCISGSKILISRWLFVAFISYFVISVVLLVAIVVVCAVIISSLDSKLTNSKNDVTSLGQSVRQTQEDYLLSQSNTTLNKVWHRLM